MTIKLAVACGLALLAASTSAQVPPDIADKIGAGGQAMDPAASSALYAPLFAGKTYDDIVVTRDVAYGSDSQQKLDNLKSLDGRQFDDAFNNDQLQGHQEAVTLFEQFAQNGDNPDLKRWAARTLPHLKSHLSMAEKLK